jgi:hypothetical protein
MDNIQTSDAPGGRYSAPSQADCVACHEGGDARVLGFSALQLSSDRDPLAPHREPMRQEYVDLSALIQRGLIRNVPQFLIDRAPRIAARTAVERAALGYLHANCGHCHNAVGPLAPLEMTLAQSVAMPNGDTAQVLRSIVDRESEFRAHGRSLLRISPGNPQESMLALRMGSRSPVEQMPPLGTQFIDAAGMALVARWIQELQTQSQTP